MGYKFTPKLIGLTRGDPRPGAKHRADGRRICEEAGSERYSRSRTLDRARSINNEYKGFCSGGECWDEMENAASKYRVKGKARNGKEYERSLRADAVIGYAIMLNPPSAMTVGWTSSDYNKFYDDCFHVLEDIEPRLFRLENIRMIATHRDEGIMDENGQFSEHVHIIGDSLDKEGHYCGNLLDAALLSRINQNFPQLMRKKGWQLENLDTTDFYRMGLDKNGKPRDVAYRIERIAKMRTNGRSFERFIADKAKETGEMYQDALKRLKAAKAIQKVIESEEQELAEKERELAKKEQELAKKEQEMSRFIEAGRRALAHEISGGRSDLSCRVPSDSDFSE